MRVLFVIGQLCEPRSGGLKIESRIWYKSLEHDRGLKPTPKFKRRYAAERFYCFSITLACSLRMPRSQRS